MSIDTQGKGNPFGFRGWVRVTGLVLASPNSSVAIAAGLILRLKNSAYFKSECVRL